MSITTDQDRFNQMVAELQLSEAAQQVGMSNRAWRLVFRYVLLPLWGCQTIHQRYPKKKVARALYNCLRTGNLPLREWLRAVTMPRLIASLQHWHAASPSAKSRHWLKLLADDSHTWHSRQARMDDLTKLFDYVQQRYAKGFNFLTLLLQVGKGPKLPLDVALWLPKGTPGHQTKGELLAEMLRWVRQEVEAAGLAWDFPDHVVLVGDGAYFGTVLVESGLRFVSKASSDQSFYTDAEQTVVVPVAELLDPQHCDVAYFKNAVNLPADLQYLRLVLTHPTWGQLLVVVVRLCQDQAPEKRLVLVSNDTKLTGVQVIQHYFGRIVIEHFFRELKQDAGMQALRFHRQGGNRGHFPLRCLTYLLVELFRHRYCRPSRTSTAKVIQRLITAELKMPPPRRLHPKKQRYAPMEVAS